MLPFLLAQLSAPPLQKGPIRLPEQNIREEITAPNKDNQPPTIQQQGIKPTTKAPHEREDSHVNNDNFVVRKQRIYSPIRLKRLIDECQGITNKGKSQAEQCAVHIQEDLHNNGYITTQVRIHIEDGITAIHIDEGLISEIKINLEPSRLQRKATQLITSLEGKPLHIPSIQRSLRLLKTVPGIKTIDAKLTSINNDNKSTLLTLNLSSGATRWQGSLTLNNSGNNGSGEHSLQTSLLKQNLLTQGDSLFLYSKAEGTGKPELGNLINSVSYTIPASDTIYLTTSAGYSNRQYIELEKPANDLSNSQLQAQAQIEWVFDESLTHRNSAFASYSWSGSELRLDGEKLPSASTPEIVRNPQSGYLRYGLNSTGIRNNINWNGSIYFLSGISAGMPSEQINEFESVGIKPKEATALAGALSNNLQISQSWQLATRIGGQLAFNNLMPNMQFNIGSDAGLRGLPGQLISGDSGWIATAESPVTVWRKENNSLQIVPFIGAGGVNTKVKSVTIDDSVGAGGLLIRWHSGRKWMIELGWVDTFKTDDNKGEWNNWSLGNGLYANARYIF